MSNKLFYMIRVLSGDFVYLSLEAMALNVHRSKGKEASNSNNFSSFSLPACVRVGGENYFPFSWQFA